MEMDRITALTDLLTQDPNNAFARYGLAMEFSNTGDFERALEEFEKLLDRNPDYVPGYHMCAQTLVKAGRDDQAKSTLESGIAAARRKGDSHAEAEMAALLEELR